MNMEIVDDDPRQIETQKATARPWRITPEPAGCAHCAKEGVDSYGVRGANDELVTVSEHDSQAPSRADCDLIVTAVNAHDALVDAAKFVKVFLNRLEDGLPEDDPLTQARRRYHAPLHAKLDAALALVDGKQQTEG